MPKAKKHFSKKDLKRLKSESIPMPIAYTGASQGNDITEIWTLSSMAGMNVNDGIPTQITITVHRPNQKPEEVKYIINPAFIAQYP